MSTTDATSEQLVLSIFAKLFVDESVIRRPHLDTMLNVPPNIEQELIVPIKQLVDAFASAAVFKDKGQVIATILSFEQEEVTMTMAQNFEAGSAMIVTCLKSVRNLLLDTRANPSKRSENRERIAVIMYKHHMSKLVQRFSKRITGFENRYNILKQNLNLRLRDPDEAMLDKLSADISQIKDLINAKDIPILVQKMKAFVNVWRSYIVDGLNYRNFQALSRWDGDTTTSSEWQVNMELR